MITTHVPACMQGTQDASQQPGVRELMGDRTELRISVWAAPDNSVTLDQVARWTWQQHGQLWKVAPHPPGLGQVGYTGLGLCDRGTCLGSQDPQDLCLWSDSSRKLLVRLSEPPHAVT